MGKKSKKGAKNPKNGEKIKNMGRICFRGKKSKRWAKNPVRGQKILILVPDPNPNPNPNPNSWVFFNFKRNYLSNRQPDLKNSFCVGKVSTFSILSIFLDMLIRLMTSQKVENSEIFKNSFSPLIFDRFLKKRYLRKFLSHLHNILKKVFKIFKIERKVKF